MLALTLSVFAFTSCEDVPAPYATPEVDNGGVYINQSFASSLTPFVSYLAEGTPDQMHWTNAYSSAVCTGSYKDDGGNRIYVAGTSWLVGPTVDLSGASKIRVSFDQAIAYGEDATVAERHEVLISNDYVEGNDPSTATWTKLDIDFDGVNPSTKNFDFVQTGLNLTPDQVSSTTTFAFRYTSTGEKVSTWEVKNFLVMEGEYTKVDPSEGGEGEGVDGSKIVTIAEFNAAPESTTQWYQLTGVVKNLKDGDQYGNFDLEDESGSVYVYGLLSEKGGAKKQFQALAAEKGIANGVTLTLVGTRGSYNDKIEVMNAYFVSVGEGGQGGQGGGETSGDHGTTQADPLTVSEALTIINGLADGATTDTEYFIKGKTTADGSTFYFNATYGQCNYYISADGSDANTIYVYNGLGLNNEKFTAKPENWGKGSEVLIKGKLQKYVKDSKVTPEIARGNYVVSVTPATPGESGGEGGGTSTGTGVEAFTNGGFESWDSGLPVNWKSACTASSASLSQSTDAHSGSYSVLVGGNDSANKRLAYKELTLPAGTYVFSCWSKRVTDETKQIRLGYVPVTDGAVGSYVYNTAYVTMDDSTWKTCSYEFTLSAETTICLVVMNCKKSNYSSGADVLIDDVTLVKK